jgi:prepilin-type N-terminal cleavage/methylation domain-containing protein
VRWQGALDDERGFTLVELTVVIIMMGLLFAIASSFWLGAIESRKVDTATNQVAADLRLANTQATNRLTDSDFTTPADTIPDTVPDEVVPRLEEYPLSTYEVGPAGALAFDWLPEGTQIATATTVRFKANSSVQVISGPPADANGIITITVRSSNDAANNHTIQINTTTSRIKVVP